MNLPASPQTVLQLIAAVVAVLIARTAWRRRDVPGSLPFGGLMLAAGWWAFFGSLEYATQDLSWRILWAKFEYLGITTITPCWFLFALLYSRKNNLSGARIDVRRSALFLLPAITVLLVITNEWHGLIWTSVVPLPGPNGVAFQFNHGLAFWIFWIYSYTLLVAGTLVLMMVIARFPALYRSQAIAIVLGAAIPWLANLAYILKIPPFGETDLTPVAFVLAGAVFAISAFRFYLFDIVPVAQDTVIESITDGVIVLDSRRRIVYTNPAAYKILNLGDRAVNPSGGKIVRPILERLKISQPKIGQSIEQAFGAYPDLVKAIQNQLSGSVELRMDGNEQRYVEMVTSNILGPRGDLSGSVITVRDITERKAIEEQRMLQSVALESAANGILITDRQGRIQWVNAAFSKITGYSPTEVIGNKPNLLKSERQPAEYYADLWHAISSGQVWTGELINRRKDGTLYTEEQTISPVRDAGTGEITHFIGVKQDITARKGLELMRDDMMKSLVHDLRNPLNSILLALDVFKILPKPIDIPEPVDIMLQIGRESALRMTTMVNAILDMSKLESGQMPVQRETVILADVVEMAFGQQAALASRSEILLLNGLSYDLPPVSADPGLLNRVLQNLLDNALKYTPNGGDIEVRAGYDPKRGEICLSVKDSGPGIPESLLPRVFDKYASGDTNRRGTGLGLAFCRLAIEAHGGKIWAESPPGQGAIFSFTLPVAASHKINQEIPTSTAIS